MGHFLVDKNLKGWDLLAPSQPIWEATHPERLKNSLMKKAVDEDGLQELDSLLKGPNALVTSEEEGAGLGVLKDFAASHKKFVVKGGMIDGTFCNAEKLAELAAIGSKENAISVFLSTLQSPLTQLALVLKALGEKGSEEAAA